MRACEAMMAAMVDLFCDSFEQVPRRIVLDIDDTEDRVHGGQQLALFHAHHDSRCFLPIHVYEATTGKPVAVILRPGKTPNGAEVALVLRHLVRAIRRHWPAVDILIRGDSHYSRPEAMAWLERNRVGYVFGLAGNKVLLARVAHLVEDTALEDQRRVAGVQVVRLEFERGRAGLRVHRLCGVGRGVAVGHRQQTEQQLRVQALEGELPPLVRDRGLHAVRVAARSEDAHALARGGRADEDGGPGEGAALVVNPEAQLS